MSLFASTSKYVFPAMRTAHSTIRSASSLSSSIRVPYTLHAQCSSNNTILTVSVDSSYSPEWGQAGGQVDAGDQPHAGRKIFSMSTGQEGFKKAQRGTFEAATATLLSCFKKMEGLLEDRGFAKTSFSRKKDQPPAMNSLTISLNGFGQGREAVYSVLTMGESYKIRRHIRTLVDKTPIRIGGNRPKKTRVL